MKNNWTFCFLIILCFLIIFKLSHKQTKKVVFVHIPKCAGTSIENAGKKLGYHWGRFAHFQDKFDTSTFGQSPKWHTPQKYLPIYYKNTLRFCVVRNPYTRILSDYKYFMKHYPQLIRTKSKTHYNCSNQDFNDFLSYFLTQYSNNKKLHIGGHLLPQSLFAFDSSFVITF